MKYLHGLSCSLLLAACGGGDSAAMDPAASTPDVLDPGQSADPVQSTDPAPPADPAQADPTAPRQAALPDPYIDTAMAATSSSRTSRCCTER
jgi:hypothetical protein